MAQQWTNKSQTQIQKSTSSNSSCLLCASQFQKAVLFFNVSLCRVLSHKIEKINIWTFGGKLKKRFCYFFALTYLLSLVSFQSVFIHVKFFTSKSILNKKLLKNETKIVRKMDTLIRWIFLCQNKWVNTNHKFLNLVFVLLYVFHAPILPRKLLTKIFLNLSILVYCKHQFWNILEWRMQEIVH